MRGKIVFALLIAGCGVKEEKFVDKYVEAECQFAIDCYEDAILEFYGWTDLATCVADRGPELVGDVEGCEYDKKKARECLKQMKDLQCPAEGEDPLVPAICTEVYAGCGADTDGGDETDEETDTDV